MASSQKGKQPQKQANPHHMWDNMPGLAEKYCHLVIREMNVHGRCSSSVKPPSWVRIGDEINKEFNLNLERKTLKNHWNEMKKKYIIWKYLRDKTGGEYNEVTGLFDLSDDAWADAIQSHPKAKEFKTKRFPNLELWSCILDPILAPGEVVWGTTVLTPPVQFENATPEVQSTLTTDTYMHDSPMEDEYLQGVRFTRKQPCLPDHHVDLDDEFSHIHDPPVVASSSPTSTSKKAKTTDLNVIFGLSKLIEKHCAFIQSEAHSQRLERQAIRDLEAAKEIEIVVTKAAEKVEAEACSFREIKCILNSIRELTNISPNAIKKALPMFAKEIDLRKALVDMESFEDQQEFVESVAEM